MKKKMESKDFHLKRNKTKYMECKFNKRQINNNLEVKIGEYIVLNVSNFRYIGSIIQSNGQINGDVMHKI